MFATRIILITQLSNFQSAYHNKDVNSIMIHSSSYYHQIKEAYSHSDNTI